MLYFTVPGSLKPKFSWNDIDIVASVEFNLISVIGFP